MLASTAILLLFRRDVADLLTLWWTSTTYGHCLFILPVVGWLVWTRRRELAVLRPAAWCPGLALVAAGGAGWLMGEAAGVAAARHFGVLITLEGAVVTILGPHVGRALLFPLAYAFFAIPFGEWLEPPLQHVTVRIVMPLLHLAGVPAAADGVLIHA
ncbi:MAG: archaeosortase/exosortase family protein, partial [Sphingomonas sp.]